MRGHELTQAKRQFGFVIRGVGRQPARVVLDVLEVADSRLEVRDDLIDTPVAVRSGVSFLVERQRNAGAITPLAFEPLKRPPLGKEPDCDGVAVAPARARLQKARAVARLDDDEDVAGRRRR